MAKIASKASNVQAGQSVRWVDRADGLQKIREHVASISESKARVKIFNLLEAKYFGRTPLYQEAHVLALARRLIEESPTIAANVPPPKPRKCPDPI